ncbi:MAG: hypothetical protein ACXV8P_02750 [Methylobacter sp.]
MVAGNPFTVALIVFGKVFAEATKKRLSFPVSIHYHFDTIAHASFWLESSMLFWWKILNAVFHPTKKPRLKRLYAVWFAFEHFPATAGLVQIGLA